MPSCLRMFSRYIVLCSAGFVVTAGLFGCGSPEGVAFLDVSTHTRQSEIIDGYRIEAERHPSVGALVAQFAGMQQLFCTGTLIAPDVVLTASHCVEILPELHSQGYTTHFTIKSDVGLDSNIGNAPFTHYEMHPNYVTSFMLPPARIPACNVPVDTLDETLCSDLKTCTDQNGGDVHTCIEEHWFDYVGRCQEERQESYEACEESYYHAVGIKGLSDAADIALVYLDSPIQNVTPSRVLEPHQSSVLVVGRLVSIVGYGQQSPESGATDFGVKVEAESTLTEVGYGEIKVGQDPSMPQQCFGDSGGPTFMDVDEKEPFVIGVTSRGYDWGDCLYGGVGTRTDIFFNWLDQTMMDACENGKRRNCERGGTLTPALDIYAIDMPEVFAAPLESGCSATGAHQTLMPLWLVMVWGLFSRRRENMPLQIRNNV